MPRLALLLLAFAVAAAPASAEWAPVVEAPVEVVEAFGDEATSAVDGTARAARAARPAEPAPAAPRHRGDDTPEPPPPEA